MKITESQLRKIIKEAINELDWKTYASAAKKAKEWREKNPYKYDRNRGMSFDRAAVNAFNKQHDIDNLPNFGGERGNINFSSNNGNVELSGSRDHDFGYDKSGMLNHNVTHLSKQYGEDGKYGRARMWDRAYETTPEEFYDDEEMATKFRNAEKDVEDFNSDKYSYDNKKGWHLRESQLRKIIQESVKKVLKENDEWGELECQHLEDEILSLISPDEFEKIKQDIITKSANKWRSQLLSQMEQVLISRNGKIEDGDMAYDWLAFDCMVGPSNRGNKINLYVTQKGPHIQYQYWTDKYENITIDKAKQIITDVINKHYDYRIKSSDLNADGLKQVLSMIK